MTRFCLTLAGALALLSLPARAQTPPPATTIALPTQWSTFYVVLLTHGPGYDAEQPAEDVRALMQRHIQYQLRLQQHGRAVAGGGFGQAREGLVGMTLLRAGSLEEAERLARADPAVEAGRLAAEVFAWYVPAGRIPE